METLKNFFECYFNQSFDFDDLNEIIQNLKSPADENYRLQLIIELHQIIQTKSYELASHIMKKYGDRILDDLKETEKFINFLYDRLIDRPTNVNAEDFNSKAKFIFCPTCCPDPEIVITYSLIQKAIVIKNNQQIYICKPCKLVWLTEDIRADNAQDYKKFMKSFGLKGTWKELSNVDLL